MRGTQAGSALVSELLPVLVWVSAGPGDLLSSSPASPFPSASALAVVGVRQPGRSGGCQRRSSSKEIHFF